MKSGENKSVTMADFNSGKFLESLGVSPIDSDKKLTNDTLVRSLTKGKLKSLAQLLGLPLRSGALKPELFSAVVVALGDEELISDELIKSVVVEVDSVEVINARSTARQQERDDAAREAALKREAEREIRVAEAEAERETREAQASEAEKTRVAEAREATEKRESQAENERLKHEAEQFKIKLEHERLMMTEQANVELVRQKAAQIQAETELTKARTRQTLEGRGDHQHVLHSDSRNGGFDVSKALRLVPKFSELDLDSFFTNFEHVASTMSWPEDKLTILLGAQITGKAAIAYSNMEPIDKISYSKVKATILAAYEEVPESYRQHFRNLRKKDSESYVEFSRNKTRLFDKWTRSREVTEYSQLRNLVLVEDFKDNIPKHVKIHLDDLEILNVETAAKKADEYTVTHKLLNQGTPQGQRSDNQPKQSNGKKFGSQWNGRPGQNQGQNPNRNQSQAKFAQGKTDGDSGQSTPGKPVGSVKHQCVIHGKNASHDTEQCYTRKMMHNRNTADKEAIVQLLTKQSTKPESRATTSPSAVLCMTPRGAGAMGPEYIGQRGSESEDRSAVAALEMNNRQGGLFRPTNSSQACVPSDPDCGGMTKGSANNTCSATSANNSVDHNETVNPDCSSESSDSTDGSDSEEYDFTCANIITAQDQQNFEQFMSQARLSPYKLEANGLPSQTEPVTMLAFRDTGSSVTLLRRGTLDLNKDSETGKSVLVAGLTGVTQSLPIHRVQMESALLAQPGIHTVEVGVTEYLPINNVGILIGNDLAAGRVTTEPIVTSQPKQNTSSEYLETEFSVCFPSCVVTRSKSTLMTEQKSDHKMEQEKPVTCKFELENTFLDDLYNRQTVVTDKSTPSFDEKDTKVSLGDLQRGDPSLRSLYAQVLDEPEAEKVSTCYLERDGVLLKKWRCPFKSACIDHDTENVEYLVVVPTVLRPHILELAHDSPTSGHFGVKKTRAKVKADFWWPNMGKEITEYVQTCEVCQIVGNPNQPPKTVPLKPIEVLEDPFSELLIDIVGPLPKSSTGFVYILTILDCTTRYPEAIPLRTATAKAVSKALLQYFSKFGLPRQVRSDQGTHFTATVMKQVLKELGIEQIFGAAYRPQTQGAVERFHSTLKSLIKKYTYENEKDWSEGLPFLLFAARSTVHESLGYSPNELVFGHNVRGPLHLFKEQCLSETKSTHILDYVVKMKERLRIAVEAAQQNLKITQTRMKTYYDLKNKVKDRQFSVGDHVLALIPTPGNALQSSYTPCTVVQKIDSYNYMVSTPERRKNTSKVLII